ncbi:MAG: hypothetical protein JW874_10030 [Spirochaetales bacterium]|nr:hypothetical protein [Spirochaetales bacterium]
MMRRYILLFLFFFTMQSVFAIKLRVITAQSLDMEIDSSDFTGGGGTDFQSQESSANTKFFWITQSSGNWQIEVSLNTPSYWPSSLSVEVRRTGNGFGGSVSGGTSYITLSGTGQFFFSGSGNPLLIPFQYRISGDIAASGTNVDVYTAEIIYTVIDGF